MYNAIYNEIEKLLGITLTDEEKGKVKADIEDELECGLDLDDYVDDKLDSIGFGWLREDSKF